MSLVYNDPYEYKDMVFYINTPQIANVYWHKGDRIETINMNTIIGPGEVSFVPLRFTEVFNGQSSYFPYDTLTTVREDNKIKLSFTGERSFTMEFIAQPQFTAHLII